MPNAPPTFSARGATRASRAKDFDRERGTAAERGYDARWVRESKAFLAANPLCIYCALSDIVTAASLVDHLYPHRGNRELFWLKRLWVPSCKPCHDSFKKQIELQGRAALDKLAQRLGLPPPIP